MKPKVKLETEKLGTGSDKEQQRCNNSKVENLKLKIGGGNIKQITHGQFIELFIFPFLSFPLNHAVIEVS